MTDIFIDGEKINICVPLDEDFLTWSGWFNSQKTTRFLEQGRYPNTLSDQKEFYLNALKSNRFVALVKCKKGKLLGVVSLSEINYEKSSCQIALVCPVKSSEAPLAALEAMALVTEHAFKRLGLKRVWAGQAYPGLKSWNQALEIIGYKSEGFSRNGFVHGWDVSDAVLISVILGDFALLMERRGGHLWPGEKLAGKILKEMKKQKPMADRIHQLISDCHGENDRLLAAIESEYAH